MRLSLFVYSLLLIALSSIAIMPRYSDSHLARTSDMIVIAEIVSGGQPEVLQGRGVCTPWRIEIDRYLKGSGSTELDFYTQGGQIPLSSRRLWVEDQALPISGRKALIFLEEIAGNWFVNGLFQGYRTIVRDEIENIPLPEYSEYILHLAHGVNIDLPRRRPMVSDLPAASASPMTITGLNPITGLAGDGTITVIISGSGFGSTRGNVEFTFYQWPGGDPNFLDSLWTTITSWTDTEIRTDIPPHASSGPIRVTPASGPAQISPMDFNVTFGYNNYMWLPDTPVYVPLLHNDATYPTTGCAEAIQRALNTWTTAGAWFRYTYDGTTTDNDSIYDAGYNGRSTVHFGYFSEASPPLGLCRTYMEGWPIMYIYEMDIRFNLAEPWSAGDPVATNDIESVMLHESGHGLQLLDVYGIGDIGEVMYGVYTTGSTRRTLSSDESDGIIYIYGSDATNIDDVSGDFGGAKISLSPTPAKDYGRLNIELAAESNVRIEIVDISGRIISVPFDGRLSAGQNLIAWNVARSMPNGVYFARANIGRESVSVKLIVLR